MFGVEEIQSGAAPVRGCCTCEICGRVDFTPDQISSNADVERYYGGTCCIPCAELRAEGYVACGECEVGSRGVRINNEAEGRKVMDWCPNCDGHGKRFIGRIVKHATS